MATAKVQKISLWNLGNLSLMLSLIVGCSSFHEVSVVSHGDVVAAGKETEAEKSSVVSLPPPEVDSSSFQMQQNEPIQLPPSAKDSVGKEIFVQSAEDTTLPWTLQDVFFYFDQMAIRRDAIPILEQNAKVLLRRYATRQVLIQGHCDERGTEAYNFILGERRATAVKNYLVDLGVEGSQLRVLSLGKSQPFCLQRTIPCFRQNRRAHFVLK